MMPNTRPRYSIVAPVFNEEETLPEFYRRMCAVTDGLDGPCELVLVFDGSRDRSPEIGRELRTRDPRVKIICFSRNFGHQIAITAGIDYAEGDAVVARYTNEMRDATGKTISVRGLTYYRLADGKIVEDDPITTPDLAAELGPLLAPATA